jgi:glc operon protein GlcG
MMRIASVVFASLIIAASPAYAAENASGQAAKSVVQKYALTLDGAKKAAAAAEAEALKNGWNVVIAITDDGGNLLYLQRLDGTQASSSETATRKARTAALFKRPTKALEDAVAGGRVSLLSLPNVTPLEGGLPILYKGEIIGAIGVSGAQSSQDAQVAKVGADALAQ